MRVGIDGNVCYRRSQGVTGAGLSVSQLMLYIEVKEQALTKLHHFPLLHRAIPNRALLQLGSPRCPPVVSTPLPNSGFTLLFLVRAEHVGV